MSGTSAASSEASATARSMSIIGFAAKPGTDVEPTCSSRSTRSPSTPRTRSASRAKSTGHSCAYSAIRTRTRRGRLLAGELLAIAHARPDVRLDVGLQLAEMVSVVVHPLLDQVGHAHVANLLVGAASLQVLFAETAHERHRISSQRVELGKQVARRPLAVIALALDGLLIPARQRRLGLRSEDGADASVEAAPLCLEHVAETFLGAPLAGCRMPGQHVIGQRRDLSPDRRAHRFQEGGDFDWRERPRGCV